MHARILHVLSVCLTRDSLDDSSSRRSPLASEFSQNKWNKTTTSRSTEISEMSYREKIGVEIRNMGEEVKGF